MKTLTVKGQKVKVEAAWRINQQVPMGAPYQVTAIIDGNIFENAFTGISNLSRSTGRYSTTYTCNKTGKRFGDSEKKCMEHLLHTI